MRTQIDNIHFKFTTCRSNVTLLEFGVVLNTDDVVVLDVVVDIVDEVLVIFVELLDTVVDELFNPANLFYTLFNVTMLLPQTFISK